MADSNGEESLVLDVLRLGYLQQISDTSTNTCSSSPNLRLRCCNLALHERWSSILAELRHNSNVIKCVDNESESEECSTFHRLSSMLGLMAEEQLLQMLTATPHLNHLPSKNVEKESNKDNNLRLRLRRSSSVGNDLFLFSRSRNSNKASWTISDEQDDHYESKRAETEQNNGDVKEKERNEDDRQVKIRVSDDSGTAEFACSQRLLLEETGYFRELLTTHAMDELAISVRCDISVFNILVKWIESNNNLDTLLDTNNVVSVVVSAHFLRMERLVHEALGFLKANINNVIEAAINLGALNDELIDKLASLYSVSELELVRDRQNKVVSRLYLRVLKTLMQQSPMPQSGIFETAATLFRCKFCHSLLTKNSAQRIRCVAQRWRLDKQGRLLHSHERDPKFDLATFIKSLLRELRTHRKLFWRLWATVHTLNCVYCHLSYPVYQQDFCPFHPQDADFNENCNYEMNTNNANNDFYNKSSNLDIGGIKRPFGKYGCCGRRAHRFGPLQIENGCQMREHRASTRNRDDKAIENIVISHRSLISLGKARKMSMKTSFKRLITPGHYNNGDEGHNERDLRQLICLDTNQQSLLDESHWNEAFIEKKITNSTTNNNVPKLSLASTLTMSLAASRWKNYGRLKREPKLPVQISVQEDNEDQDEEEDEEDESSDDDEPIHLSIDNSNGTKNNRVWMSWDTESALRINQDNQRDAETKIEAYLVKKFENQINKGSLTQQQMASSTPKHASLASSKTWSNLQKAFMTPTSSSSSLSTTTAKSGSFAGLESAWQQTHALYLVHKANNEFKKVNNNGQNGRVKSARNRLLRP